MNNEKFAKLEAELRETELLLRSDVQRLLRKLEFNLKLNKSPNIFDSLFNRLEAIIKKDKLTAKREPDCFRPHAPEVFCHDGDITVCTQPDGTDYSIDVNSLTCGALLAGPQGSGKSRLLTSLIHQIHKKHKDVLISVIDFKNGFKNLAPTINAKSIDLSKISLTLDPPSGIKLEDFVFQLIPLVAESVGLVYGVDLLNTAAERALEKVKEIKDASLCLRDILEELKHISTKSFRIGGYLDADKTALGFLIGKQNLFSCRKGVSLNDLLTQNVIVNARCMTHDSQAKFLVTYILYWLYQAAKNEPESKKLKHVLIVDDANRAIAKPTIGNSISSLGNILSVIRSSGRALIAASQLPCHIDPAVVSLSRNMLVVGNINGSANIKVIKDFVGLTFDKANAITQFKQREMLAFVSNSSWSKPVHGFVPFVEDLPETPQVYEDYSNVIEEWRPLSQLLTEKPVKTVSELTAEEPLEHVSKLDSDIKKLIWDCLHYPFDKVRSRVKRLNLSVRAYESAMNVALQDGWLLRSMAGKSVYLVATKKSFKADSIPCPYERSVSVEHAFYVNFVAHILKQNPKIQNVQIEVAVGTKGQTTDVVATTKDCEMIACELTLNTSNLLSNATKLQDTSFKHIVWITKTSTESKAVQAYFNKTVSIPETLRNKFIYTFINDLIKKGGKVCV